MPHQPFRRAYHLGYVPSLDRPPDTVQIVRLTNGRGTLLTDDPAEIRRIPRGRNAGTKMRLFSSALSVKPGMVPFVRLARREDRTIRFAYFPRGDVAQIELLQQGWTEERVLGCVSVRQLINTVPLYFDPPTTPLTLAALGHGIAAAATTADSADLQMGAPADAVESAANGTTGFLLVPKEATAKSLRIWVGKLDIEMPAQDRRLNIWDPSTRAKIDEIFLRAAGWKSALEKEGFNCWFQEVTASQLSAGKHYCLVLVNEITGAEDAYGEASTPPLSLPTHVPLDRWDIDGGPGARRGRHDPGPVPATVAKPPAAPASSLGSMPAQQRRSFKIFAGSCYASGQDKGRVAAYYTRLYSSIASRPDLKILLGNQVYLDAPWYRGLAEKMRGGYSRETLADCFLGKYGKTWTGLGPLLCLGATCCITGDHDYWSGYPDDTQALPQLFDAQRRADWELYSRSLRDVFQSMRSTYTIDIGNDLSVFLFDVRRNRTRKDVAEPRFADQADLLALRNWVLRLRGPGVIAGGHILFDDAPGSKANLRSYPSQYGELCQILAASSHDLVYLGGNANFGRIAQARFPGGQKLIEIVTSPMSLIEDDGNYIRDGADGESEIAKDVWLPGQDIHPQTWPQIPVVGVGALPITYLEAAPASRDDTERTEENFMILSFARDAQTQAVRMKVNCYLPRRQEKAFSRVFELN